jgi:hypothetical protein
MAGRQDQLDFHQIVGGLGSYPPLLRRLGLVLDLRVPVDELGLEGGLADLRLRARPTNLDLPETDHHAPWSSVAFEAAGAAGTGRFAMATPATGISLATLTLDASRTLVAQENVEQVAIALLHGESKAADRAGLEADAGSPPAPELPALVQGGMRFTHRDAPSITGQARADQARLLHSLEQRRLRATSGLLAGADDDDDDDDDDPMLLHADHVLRGFRVDVRDVADGVWRSLCRRRVTYAAGNWTWSEEDEGVIEPMVYEDDEAEEGGARATEDLFDWDGWSLVVPRDSGQQRRVAEAQNNCAARGGTTLTVSARVPPGSLQPQRFGHCYEFRLRNVDLAGNGASPDADAPSPGITVSPPVCCLRVESVKPPVVLRATPRGPNEGGDIIVLRDADDAAYRTDEFRLHVLPPEVPLSLLERHGVFDAFTGEESWSLIANLRGQGEGEKETPEYVPGKTYYAPYLPDPLVRQAVLRLPDGGGNVDLPPFDDIPAGERGRHLARSCLLVVRPGGNRVEAGVAGREVTLRVPRGRVQKVQLVARLTAAELAVLAPAHPEWEHGPSRRADSFSARLLARAERGDVPPLAPPATMTIVYATQRPLEPPAFRRPLILPRVPASSVAKLADDDLYFDRPSTGRIDVYARWEDPVDDPTEPRWTVASNAVHAGGAIIDEDGGKPFDPAEFADSPRSPLAHDLGDTRHREVTYRAVAESRFTAFYPPSLTDDPDNVTLASAPVTLSVPATAPPDAPDIAYVVPTIGRADAMPRALGSEQRIATRGEGLRIYMNRGWFSSGRGEQLALVLGRGRETVERRISVSEWGENPLRVGPPGPGALPAPGNRWLPAVTDRAGGPRASAASFSDRP